MAESLMETKRGLEVPRRFVEEGENVYDKLEYKTATSKITEPDGTVVFEMDNVEVPKDWSQLPTDTLALKYFRKAGLKTPEGRETSIKQVVHRIAHTIRTEGQERGYFAEDEDAQAFEDELSYMLLTQRGAFNSPVWFNCGLYHDHDIQTGGGLFFYDPELKKSIETETAYEHPQCSACFIQPVKDDLMEIYGLVQNEARLFKYGSGTGSNFSALRSKYEKLSGGGTSSGLMSFLEVFDRAAGATKSGGTTRRAAKMVCLDMDHPEILDFVRWKSKEELKAKALIDAGYDSNFNGEAYKTVSGQNSNNSVRLTDAFMESYEKDGTWKTIARTTGETVHEYSARFLMNEVAKAAWSCADPGVQFDTTINEWHTCPNSDRIYASNPCSEYMFLDNTACNLSSINLMKFADERGNFDIEGYRHAIRIFTIAMEIIVGFSSYPTAPVAQMSYEYRTLGLGYANLGTLLMVNGVPYDSDQGRAWAGAISAILCGDAYKTSAELAAVQGPFTHFAKNRDPMLRVMNKHRDAAYQLDVRHTPEELLKAARESWDEAVELGDQFGYRNAQSTVIAPTGTIGLLMDCATTGIEPDFSLVKWKKLAGGGFFKIVNNSIMQALNNLGYTKAQTDEIIQYILGDPSLERAFGEKINKLKLSDEQKAEAQAAIEASGSLDQYTPHVNPQALRDAGFAQEQIKLIQKHIGGTQTIEGAPHVREEHYAVFDCANRCGDGERFIDPMGHVRMMAAVQPFISGAISKTVNLPGDATVEEIERIYVESWRLGLKACALYRDGCKSSQPLNSSADAEAVTADATSEGWGVHKPLPTSRKGLMVDTKIGPHSVFLRTGEYEDGSLGEVEVQMHKEGAILHSFMKTFTKAVSLGLQHGVPLDAFVKEFTFTKFEPAGMTNHQYVKTCTSVTDFLMRVLAVEYLGQDDFAHVKPERSHAAEQQASKVTATKESSGSSLSDHLADMMGDAPACNDCGHITVRNGTCYKCLNCGTSMGCS